MNSLDSEDGDHDEQQCRAVDLHAEAAKLDMYRRERLAYTAISRRNSSSRPVSKRISSLLKAMHHWVHSRL